MARRSFSTKDRTRIFAANSGICHLCAGKISIGEAWEVEHVIPYALTRDNSDENLRPAHKRCHEVKTRQDDVPAIAKAKRREAKHTGAKQPKGQWAKRNKAPRPEPKTQPPRRSLYATWAPGMDDK